MRPYEVMRHPPGGFGIWHVGWHDLFWLALPVLFVLPLLALLVALLWPARHALLGRLGNRPENAYYPPPVGQTAGATSAGGIGSAGTSPSARATASSDGAVASPSGGTVTCAPARR